MGAKKDKEGGREGEEIQQRVAKHVITSAGREDEDEGRRECGKDGSL